MTLHARSCVMAAVVAAVLAAPVALPTAARSALLERVIAAVNNDVITLSDLRHTVAYNAAIGGKGNGRRLAVETLEGIINRKLLLQEASRLGFVEVTEQDARAETQRLRERLGSDDAFQAFLSRVGMSEDQLTSLLGEQLVVQRFVERKIELYARVSRDDVEAYYREHHADYMGRQFSEVQKQITSMLSGQLAAQQLDSYLAELRSRAMIRINPLRDDDGF